jgi:hypothetical protein
MMTISDVISKYYDKLKINCKNNDIPISMGRTSEDIIQDVCVTALRKFKQKEIEEDEGLSYLKKTLFTELHFQYARKKNEKVIFVENLHDVIADE